MFNLITGDNMELSKQADRMMKSLRARKKRKQVKEMRLLRQHRLYAKLHREKKNKQFTNCQKYGIIYIMNIFILNNDPVIAAQEQCDKHVVKMIVESAQMLSTVHRMLDGVMERRPSKSGAKLQYWKLDDEREDLLYKACHFNHPSTVWTRESCCNYTWHYNHFIGLCDEYTYH